MAFNIPTPQGDHAILKKNFDQVDKDGSGQINPKELQAALSSGGYTFSASVAEKLVKMFDQKDRSGTLDFSEFIQCHKFIDNMAQAFARRDTSKDGILDGNEVRAALVSSGFQISDPVFQLLMRKYDHERIGGLNFADYIDASIFLSSVRNVFAYYDKGHKNAVLFDFDSFLGASLSIN